MAERRRQRHRRNGARGVATLEFALILMFGVVPLLLLTFSGVMIFAAKQSLTLAAAEGARAALRYGSEEERIASACASAAQAMGWLLEFSGEPGDCDTGPIDVARVACAGAGTDSGFDCMRVEVRYDHDAHPFLPGAGRLYGWLLDGPIGAVAVVRLGEDGDRAEQGNAP